MRIFLSYGHDKNASVVELIRAGLEAAGHEPWVDTAQIKAGEDWRRSIVDGLAETDWVLGFLSQHSVRDPGVCLDELAIALHAKGGTIATVLLEGEAAAGAPVSISHVQWLDMADWAPRLAEGGGAWESWFKAKLDEILSLLANPATQRFAGEISELEMRLKPVSQEAETGILVDGFVGREWLLRQLDTWRKTARTSRLLWICGPAGTGKSAFAAWLGHWGKVNVIGLNLCAYNKDDRRDATRVIRTIAFQIATRLPDYRRLLLNRLKRQDSDGSEMALKSPAALFGWVIVEPLRLAIDGGRRNDRYLIVIDGVDETVRDGQSELADVLASEASKLPDWMAIVVTSRPEEPIVRQFSSLQPVRLEATSPENLDDVRAYVRGWLQGQPDLDVLVERIVAAAEGNFLYVRTLREAVAAGTLSLEHPESLPRGLVGLYGRWFRHRFPKHQDYERHLPLLSVLAVAEHPVPEKALAAMFGWSSPQKARMLEGLGSLFERRPEGVAPFHKSLRDWLTDEGAAGADFLVPAEEGAARLFNFLWDSFGQTLGRDQGPLDSFCLAELPLQITRRSAAELRAKISLEEFQRLGSVVEKVAESQEALHQWHSALAWWKTGSVLATAFGEDGLTAEANAKRRIGRVELTLGRTTEALSSYRSSLALNKRLAESDPGNSATQHRLAITCQDVGDVVINRGDLAIGLKLYREGHAILEQLVSSCSVDSCPNPDILDSLSRSYVRVGDALSKQGDLPGALESFRGALAVNKRLTAFDPTNTEWQRNIAVSHQRIGDVLLWQQDHPAALNSYRDFKAVIEPLAASDPSNRLWQSDLGVSYERVGVELCEAGDLSGASTWFGKALAIMEGLVKSDPDNVAYQRGPAFIYDKLGGLQVRIGNLAQGLEYYMQALAIRERLVSRDPSNAEWEASVSNSCYYIGDALVAQGDLTGGVKQYGKSLAIRTKLLNLDPSNKSLRGRQLSVVRAIVMNSMFKSSLDRTDSEVHSAVNSAFGIIGKLKQPSENSAGAEAPHECASPEHSARTVIQFSRSFFRALLHPANLAAMIERKWKRWRRVGGGGPLAS
jgi:tetratricopeptide (TPR) repeat protein